jgi:hypothetical protein
MIFISELHLGLTMLDVPERWEPILSSARITEEAEPTENSKLTAKHKGKRK